MRPYGWLQPIIQVWQFHKEFKSCPHRALSIILMSHRVTEVDQQPIPEVFRQVSLEASDDSGADFLIGVHHLSQFFGIELL